MICIRHFLLFPDSSLLDLLCPQPIYWISLSFALYSVSWTPSFLLKRYVLTGIRDGPHEPFIADSVDFVVSQVICFLHNLMLISNLLLATSSVLQIFFVMRWQQFVFYHNLWGLVLFSVTMSFYFKMLIYILLMTVLFIYLLILLNNLYYSGWNPLKRRLGLQVDTDNWWCFSGTSSSFRFTHHYNGCMSSKSCWNLLNLCIMQIIPFWKSIAISAWYSLILAIQFPEK